MRPRQFLDLASQLAESGGAAACRSAISRAYYAVFNAGQQFLERMGPHPPKTNYHVVLQRRLLVSGDKELEQMGAHLGGFHAQRIRADYRMEDKIAENQDNARAAVLEATQMMETLETCPIHSDRWKKIKERIQKLAKT